MFRPTTALLALAAIALTACGGDTTQAPHPEAGATPTAESGTARHIRLSKVATGFNRPVWVGAAPGRNGLWVAEQPGRVLRLDGRRRTTVLDLASRVTVGAEQGLLGIAFHPAFAGGKPLLYVHYSDRRGDTRVAEYRIGRRARRTRELLFVDQPEENHNGGQLAFGPDGRLYLGLGDGGGAFDPDRLAQDPDTKLGKLIAADVDTPKPQWETILYGLRNPWRFSFDFALNELWIGDVGQDQIEEIDRVPIELDEPPKNLGWSAYEGTRRLKRSELAGNGELVFPVAQYRHEHGCSVTGGVVYHGTAIPALDRRYIYGDYCSGTLWTLRPKPGKGAEDVRRERATVPQLTHIGTDAAGELVFASGAGTIYRATD